MKIRCLYYGIFIVPAFLFASCKEDPELIEKSRNQKEEISRLQNEITLVDAQLRNVPQDKNKELASAEARLKELTLEANRIDSEVTELEKEKNSLEKEFADYKKKYPIK